MSDTPAQLQVDITLETGGAVAQLRGEIDLRSSPKLRAALLQVADRKPTRVIVDLAGVTYVDSSGVGTLVEFKRRLERAGGKVVLSGLQPRVRSVFEITKLDQFFMIAGSIDEARTA